MKHTFSYNDIWKIAFPIILGSVAQNIINITDTAFLGHYGEIELAASAIAGVFYFAFFMIGYGVAIGTQIIIARRFGEQKYSEIGRFLDHTVYILLILALFLFLIMKFVAPVLLHQIISSPAICSKVIDFLDYRAYGLFFAFLNISIGAFYIGTASTTVIIWSNLIMAIVNAIMAYCLIFGNMGFSPMGIKGAAIANTLAEVFASVFLILWTIKKIDLKKFALLKFSKPALLYFKKLLNVSSPLMLEFLISFSAWFIFFLMVEKIGQRELAVSNIVRSVYIILMLPIWGFGAAVSSLVSNLLGQNKSNEVMKLIGKSILLCFSFIAIPVIFTFAFPNLIISIYTSDTALAQYSIYPVYVVSAVLLPISVAFILFHGVSGTGNTRTALLIETSVIVLYLLYVYLLTHIFKSNVTTVWTSEFIYAGFLAIFSFIYLKKGNWSEKKI